MSVVKHELVVDHQFTHLPMFGLLEVEKNKKKTVEANVDDAADAASGRRCLNVVVLIRSQDAFCCAACIL
jgi:hypothetical protein